jgi:predicted amidophosphoribosyltransferase
MPVSRPRLPAAYALAAYEGPAGRAVLAYKERCRRELAAHFAAGLAEVVPGLARAGPVVLVPAPSRPAAARRRGGQHMAVVARRCAARLRESGLRAGVVEALRLDGRAVDSVGLDALARAANLAGRVRPVAGPSPPPGVPVLLLDDVITTGATAAACVSALAAVGTKVSAVLAITATT